MSGVDVSQLVDSIGGIGVAVGAVGLAALLISGLVAAYQAVRYLLVGD